MHDWFAWGDANALLLAITNNMQYAGIPFFGRGGEGGWNGFEFRMKDLKGRRS